MLLEAGRSFSPAVMSQTDEDEVDSAFHAEGVRVSFLPSVHMYFIQFWSDQVLLMPPQNGEAPGIGASLN